MLSLRADIEAWARRALAFRHVAPGGEAVFEVNGWTVTVRPSHRRVGLAALMVRRGARVMHLDFNEAQITAFDPDAFWRADL
jgi:hypothetical protein